MQHRMNNLMFRQTIKTISLPFQRYTLWYHRIQFYECVLQSVKIHHLRIIYVITTIVAIWWWLSAPSWNFYLHRIKIRSLHLACSYEHKSSVSTSISSVTLHLYNVELQFFHRIKHSNFRQSNDDMKHLSKVYPVTHKHIPENENEQTYIHTYIHWTLSQFNVSCYIHWIRSL